MIKSTEVLVHSSVAQRYPLKLQRYARIMKKNNIPFLFIDASEENYLDYFHNVRAYIHHYVHRETEKQVATTVLPIIDKILEIPCFPNYSTRWHFDDKVKQFLLLKAKQFPSVESWVFWDIDSAKEWLKQADLPVVFKLKSGAGSKNVILLTDKAQVTHLIQSMFSSKGIDSSGIPNTGNLDRFRNMLGFYTFRQKLAVIRKKIHYQDVQPYWQQQRDYVYFQKFLSGNKFDTRVTVIGYRAFAFRRYNRLGDFRASGSGNLNYNQNLVDQRCIKIAFDISITFGFQSMAYDFLFDENNEPRIGEISYAFIDHAIYECPGFFDKDMHFHVGNYWPQFCILQDLLNEPDLVQPSKDAMTVC